MQCKRAGTPGHQASKLFDHCDVKLGDFGQVHTITQKDNHANTNSQTPGRLGTEGSIAPEMGVTTNMD